MMLLRISMVAALLSTTVTDVCLQTVSADWYGIQIRSQEQAALEAAEKNSSDLNLPRTTWFEDAAPSGASKPNSALQAKPGSQQSELVEDKGFARTNTEWRPAEVSKEAAAQKYTIEKYQAEQSVVATTKVQSESLPVQSEIAQDVDRLLNQEGKWFAPIPGAEEASLDVQKISFTQSSGVAESMSYMDELRELEGKKSHWIQSSVVNNSGNYDLNVDFEKSGQIIETQPMFLNELEAMVSRQTQGSLPDHIAELEELRSGRLMMITSSERLLAQGDAAKGYNPEVGPGGIPIIDQAGSLFPAITQIKVTGGSSVPRKVEINDPPTNEAAKYMDTLIPGEYVMGPVQTISAPSRYPLCFNHNPLYYEDPNLERCGASCGYLTTAFSAVKFLGNTAAIPYLLVVTPPKTCLASLGDCPTCAEFGTDAYFREWKRQ